MTQRKWRAVVFLCGVRSEMDQKVWTDWITEQYGEDLEIVAVQRVVEIPKYKDEREEITTNLLNDLKSSKADLLLCMDQQSVPSIVFTEYPVRAIGDVTLPAELKVTGLLMVKTRPPAEEESF